MVTRAGSTGAPYDLLGANPGAVKSTPTCRALSPSTARYPAAQAPESFAWQLKKMLSVRAGYRINESEQVDVPAVKARGLVVRSTGFRPARRPRSRRSTSAARSSGNGGHQTAPPGGAVKDLLEDKALGRLDAAGGLELALDPHQGQVLLIK